MGFFELFAAALTGFYGLIPSYGLAIILLTIAVRILLLPLSIKQTRSMREMQRIQPEVKKLQAKYKGNRQKLNEEMMKLYKEHNVNPFGGCLPLLMQFPVLIGLFYVVRTPLQYMGYRDAESAPDIARWVIDAGSRVPDAIQNSALAQGLLEFPERLNGFLGIRLDCSAAASLNGDVTPNLPDLRCGDGLVSALPYIVLVLLMGFTTYYQQKQMQARQTPGDPAAAQMQMFTRIMPFFLMFLAWGFPTGVVIYWLTTNVWTIGQQRLMLRVAPPVTHGKGEPPAAAKGAAKGSNKPSPGKPPKGAPGKPNGKEPPKGALPEAGKNPTSDRKKRRK